MKWIAGLMLWNLTLGLQLLGRLSLNQILTDTWCSSGGLSANGTFVQTGGSGGGGRSVRYLSGCNTCDWEEHPMSLSASRWFSTQHILPNGNFILVGGRRMFNYEYIPDGGGSNDVYFPLPFLQETTDLFENNLYPFVFLSTDGNILIFANNRSILLNPTTNKIVRELPILDGVKYPTELRVKKFCPPYFDPLLISDRPAITSDYKGKMVKYRGYIVVEFKLKKAKVDQLDLKVVALPSAEIAPPGFYLIFVVHNGVPSSGIWVQIA
ncbi:hypothetical protein C1H46_035314 [Malus baccata]|uniref:Galactose oxidase-like Early set domain-containing protein n=1 Tax=Malus baccata TaxID=106549 RepID=A0A540KY10_MALBA|nr:hypothetical protein C1H46_035314 [Malus baccata]